MIGTILRLTHFKGITTMKLCIKANMTLDKNQQAIEELRKKAIELGFELIDADSEEKPDFYIALGGDGSILRAIHSAKFKDIPFASINTGSLGYLTTAHITKLNDVLVALKNEDYIIDSRTTLAGAVKKAMDSEPQKEFMALNDFVIMRTDSGRTNGFELFVNNVRITEFLCDGMIFATPTGSTAYSLSAGGPIVLPGAAAIIVNVICPHTLTSRPLVLPDTDNIELRVSKANAASTFSHDGVVTSYIEAGDTIRITKSTQQIKLVKLSDYDPFVTLSKKLGWNGCLTQCSFSQSHN